MRVTLEPRETGGADCSAPATQRPPDDSPGVARASGACSRRARPSFDAHVRLLTRQHGALLRHVRRLDLDALPALSVEGLGELLASCPRLERLSLAAVTAAAVEREWGAGSDAAEPPRREGRRPAMPVATDLGEAVALHAPPGLTALLGAGDWCLEAAAVQLLGDRPALRELDLLPKSALRFVALRRLA